MYNFALAFVICAILYLAGDAVSNLTKAWVPSVFVTAVLILIGYWTIIPKTLVSDSVLIPFGSTIGIYLLISHMGTVISIAQLIEQWKTIVICLAGLAGMCALSLLVLPGIIGMDLVMSGLPPLTGGIVAATTMQSAAQAASDAAAAAGDAAAAAQFAQAAVFAIVMYCVQGFAGYPLTAVCLQLEGKAYLKKYRAGEIKAVKADENLDAESGNFKSVEKKEAKKKKLIPAIPDHWNSAIMILGKLGVCAWLATQFGTIQFPGIGAISGAVWALVFGVILTTIGFLDENALNKANSYGIIMFALMMYVFDGLKDCTPEMLVQIIGPMLLLVVVGVLGMAILVFVFSKVLKTSFLLSFATALTALYGFPPNAIITENTCKALAQNEDEKEALMGHMFAPMIVGGFTTVTITSVIIAGLFAGYFTYVG